MFSKLRLSISTRLALWYGFSVLLLLGLFGTYLYVSFHVGLHRDFAAALEREKTHLLQTVQQSAASPKRALRLASRPAASNTYVRLLSPEGDVQDRTPNLASRGELEPVPPASAQEKTVARHWGAAHARTLYVPLDQPGGGLAGWLEITRLESQLHRELHRLAWLLTLGGLLAAAVAIAAGYGLARRALRPVSRLTRAARQIQEEGLGRHLPTTEGVRDELTDLAEAFNGMLAQLETSFQRERRFRADAAHELMTPLSAVQSEAEVTLRKRRNQEDYEESIRRILQRSRKMSALVEGLLQLSRAERPPGRLAAEKVSLSRVAKHVLDQIAPRAEAKQLMLSEDIAPNVMVRGDEESIGVMTENLVDNAIKYTPERGEVTVSVSREEGEAVLQVRDTGAGFAPEQANKLFDRFYRLTENGSNEAGTGLGLPIAQALAAAHGGRISARSEGPDRGSTFEVRLPLIQAKRAGE